MANLDATAPRRTVQGTAASNTVRLVSLPPGCRSVLVSATTGSAAPGRLLVDEANDYSDGGSETDMTKGRAMLAGDTLTIPYPRTVKAKLLGVIGNGGTCTFEVTPFRAEGGEDD